MRLYYALGTVLRPLGLVGMYCYSLLTRRPRVRVVALNEHSEVLLVQTWLGGSAWSLPGGGANRREPLVHAAAREVEEETGLTVNDAQLQSLITLRSLGHSEVIFTARLSRGELPEPRPSKYEIKNRAWFALSALPQLDPLAEQILGKVALNE
jgi:8-oxo-dGTP diphosphatase